jgi:tryptophan-rich sensory protein
MIRPMPPHPPSLARQAVGLVVALAVTYVAAAIGGLGSVDAPAFYAQLDRPSWAPPAWLFGPAWAVLFTLMAIAAWWVWRAVGWPRARPALGVFAAQLLANALWSWLFFAWR